MTLIFYKDKKGQYFHEGELEDKSQKNFSAFRSGKGRFLIPKKGLERIEDDLIDDLTDPLIIQYLATVYGTAPTLYVLENIGHVNHFACRSQVSASQFLPYEPEFYKKFQLHFGIHPFSLNTSIMGVFGYYSFDLIAFETLLRQKQGYKEETHGSLRDFLTKTCGADFTEEFLRVLIKKPAPPAKLAA